MLEVRTCEVTSERARQTWARANKKTHRRLQAVVFGRNFGIISDVAALLASLLWGHLLLLHLMLHGRRRWRRSSFGKVHGGSRRRGWTYGNKDPVLPRAKSGLETEMRLCPNPEHTKTCDARQLEAGGRLRLTGRCSHGASRCQGLTAATVSPFTRQWNRALGGLVPR